MRQQNLSLLGALNNEVKDLPWDVVAKHKTIQSAYRLCINQQRIYRTQDDLADLLGMKSRAQLNAIINSDRADQERHLGRVREIELQKLCGNRAIDQWAKLFEQEQLDCQRSLEERRKELTKALELLDRQIERNS